jgi:hypothetical protein
MHNDLSIKRIKKRNCSNQLTEMSVSCLDNSPSITYKKFKITNRNGSNHGSRKTQNQVEVILIKPPPIRLSRTHKCLTRSLHATLSPHLLRAWPMLQRGQLPQLSTSVWVVQFLKRCRMQKEAGSCRGVRCFMEK